MRVAAVDIGTNSVLLLVAERRADGELVAIEERATVTRLGQRVDQTRTLHADAVSRTNACLSSYAEAVRALHVDRVGVVGTSALRDAAGGRAVTDVVESALGTQLRVIAGQEEARLTFLGAVSGLGGSEDGQCAIDVGGGSTEVVLGRMGPGGAVQLQYAHSFDVGSVRLTERFIENDPPLTGELDDVRSALDAMFTTLPELGAVAPPIGIAGTATTLAAISLRLESYDGARVHGHTLPIDEIDRIVTLLARLPLVERRRVVGLHPGRADVIVSGGLVFLALMRRMRAETLRISDRGLRWGLAIELARAR